MAEAGAASRTRMNKNARREAIFREAVRVLSEKGYHGFSLNELARRCGLTHAGLLHHFSSKEDLLVAVLRERDRIDEQILAGVLGEEMKFGPRTLSTCLASLRAIVTRNVDQPELIRLYAILRAEALVPGHPAFTFFRTRELAIIEIFRDLLSDLVPDPLPTARQILAFMHGLEIQWLRESRIFDLVEEWDNGIHKILGHSKF